MSKPSGDPSVIRSVAPFSDDSGKHMTFAAVGSSQVRGKLVHGSLRREPAPSLEPDVDHIIELGQAPTKAFSSRNLRLTYEGENRVMLNQLHSQDPFLPNARMTVGKGTSLAGRFRGATITPPPN